MQKYLLLNDQQDNHDAVPPQRVGSAAVAADGFLDFGARFATVEQEGSDTRGYELSLGKRLGERGENRKG